MADEESGWMSVPQSVRMYVYNTLTENIASHLKLASHASIVSAIATVTETQIPSTMPTAIAHKRIADGFEEVLRTLFAQDAEYCQSCDDFHDRADEHDKKELS